MNNQKTISIQEYEIIKRKQEENLKIYNLKVEDRMINYFIKTINTSLSCGILDNIIIPPDDTSYDFFLEKPESRKRVIKIIKEYYEKFTEWNIEIRVNLFHSTMPRLNGN